MKNNIIKAVLVAVVLGGISSSALAGSIEGGGFGNSTMKSAVPVAKKDGECLSFEATFSEPMDKSPSAMLDLEQHFVNMYNKFLEVTKISDKKYRLSLTADVKNGEKCPEIAPESRVTISTYSGSEKQDERQTLPEAISFTAEKSGSGIKLKKE